MVSALVPGSSGPDSSPGRGHCCVLGQDILLSQCLSPPTSINEYRRIVGETLQIAGSDPRWTSIPSRGSSNTPSRFMLRKPG